MLQVEIVDSAEEADRLMCKAEAEHDAALEENEALRDKLPTTLRKLTAGYELRTCAPSDRRTESRPGSSRPPHPDRPKCRGTNAPAALTAVERVVANYTTPLSVPPLCPTPCRAPPCP